MQVAEVLRTWVTLQKYITKITEEEARQLLRAEKRGKNRLSFLNRIYSRYSVLRHRRETRELLEEWTDQ